LDASINYFLWHRGYAESFRGYSQWLPLENVNPDAYQVNWERLNQAEVHLRSLSALRFEWDCAQKFYDLYLTLENDAPRADEQYLPLSFEEFCANNFDSPSALPDGVTIAVRLERQCAAQWFNWGSQRIPWAWACACLKTRGYSVWSKKWVLRYHQF
jgi:hypothetical protein